MISHSCSEGDCADKDCGDCVVLRVVRDYKYFNSCSVMELKQDGQQCECGILACPCYDL